MKLVLVPVLAALAVALVPAQAGAHRQRTSTFVSVLAVAGNTTALTPQRLPAPAHTTVHVSFDGKAPQASWSDSPSQIEYGWRGVLVVVSAKKRAAPALVRVASTRSTPTRVNVRFSW